MPQCEHHRALDHGLGFLGGEGGGIKADFEPQPIDQSGQADRRQAGAILRHFRHDRAQQRFELSAGAPVDIGMDGSDAGIGPDQAPESGPGREQIGIKDGFAEIGLEAGAELVARIVARFLDRLFQRGGHAHADILIGGEDEGVDAVEIMGEQPRRNTRARADGADRRASDAFFGKAPRGRFDQRLSPHVRAFANEARARL